MLQRPVEPSQYLSIRYTDRLEAAGAVRSVGSYLAGAVLFIAALRTRAWHTVVIGFLAATPLTILLLVATLLHWELFNHDHPAFWVWVVVYVLTPVLLPAAWWRNRLHDPGAAPAGTPMVPRAVRLSREPQGRSSSRSR